MEGSLGEWEEREVIMKYCGLLADEVGLMVGLEC